MTINQLKTAVYPLLNEKGAKKAILFGSCAQQKNDPRSDIDLLIIDNEELPYLKRLDKYYSELVDILQKPLDIFVYKESEYSSMKNSFFIKRIDKEGIVLYER